ncbi:PAS domain S-box protein [Rariglobus hedericola]|uniref:PAS domain S-box protein n=1 Tax=Rariglobus hedericola TaxID=2597822 RepID=UPI001396BF0F|nr:PAS domain S-box protein [Rariglobus hedericola]
MYAVVATLWIFLSDRALGLWVADPARLVELSVYKGCAFVAVTSVLLLLLMRYAFGTAESRYATLREQEREIRRLNRLNAALGHINQAIVRLPVREELFKRVCDVLVEQGGFRLAWIGWRNPETERLEPLGVAGDENDYIKNIQVYADERPEGMGPSGRAFRSKHAYVCNDMLNDEATSPWRAELIRRRFRASVAIPIRVDDQVGGVLSVYSDEKDFFQDKEMALLNEAATDIAFALANLARENERHAAELRAQNERRFSDTMIESMPGILYFYDMDGRFLRWNRNFERVSGYSGEQLAGMQPLDFFAAEDKPALEQRIGEVFRLGESSIEAPFLSKDGGKTPYFFTGRRVESEGRLCLVGVGIDITERKRAEEALHTSEERYRSTLDSILEGCQLLGHDWRYLYLNNAAAIQNRRPNAELLGRTMSEAWPGIEDSPVFAMLKICLEQRVALHDEIEFRFMDGTSGWFDVRCQPVPEGIFVLSIDITERKKAEDALRELNVNLEHKVVARTDELRAALVRAEAADRLKSAFLATMSHELRTPLNSIIGFTGIVLQGLAGPLNAEQTKQLGMVRGSARHLLELINDVLDISKIEAGQLEVRAEPFDLRESVERVAASVRPLAEKKGLELVVQFPPGPGAMTGDRRRVEQVLINLLNNAIKFTDQGRVKLDVEGLASTVRLRVTDTGIGIKPHDLATLFQPFRQIDTGLSRQHEGTGLGLAICRRLVMLMGGEITASSEWSRGSDFMVTLPLQPQAES